MAGHNFAPHATETGTSLGNLGLVDESNLLAEVELRRVSIVHTVDLEERGVVVGVPPSTTVPEDGSLGVQAHRLRCEGIVSMWRKSSGFQRSVAEAK